MRLALNASRQDLFCGLALSAGLVATVVAIAAIVVGHYLLLPGLEAQELVDRNLALALARPLRLQTANLLLASLFAVCLCSRVLVLHRVGSTLALAAGLFAALDRFYLIPRLHSAWERVDAVAQRPVNHYETALSFGAYHEWAIACVLTIAAAILLLAFSGARAATPPRPAKPDEA